MSSLPDSWMKTILGEVIEYGKTSKAEPADLSGDTWVLELEDIEKETSKILKRLTFQDRQSKSTKNKFKKGDVLYGKLRPYLEKVVVADGDGVCTTEIVPLSGDPLLNNRYIFYWMKHPEFKAYVTEVGYGVNMPRLGTKDGKAAPFVLAPGAEQIRIAQKLDQLTSQVDTLKARVDAIPNILKRFRQSVLAAAVSGKLTEEWRGGNDKKYDLLSPILFSSDDNGAIPEGWAWEKLVNVAKLESGHTPRKSVSEYWDDGDIPWISLQDIRGAHGTVIDRTKFMPTQLGIDNSSARLLPKGTVCFCRDISVGYATVMGKSMSTTQHFANWVCGDRINNMYLLYSFMAGKEYLTRSGQGTTVKTIYMPALKELSIALPSIDEQKEIVCQVQKYFNLADKIEAKVSAAQAQIDHLTQSVIAKAFRGELVPQDPNDEPASKLLENIKAQRELEKPKKRTKKKKSS